jgi:hypothetical protein
LILSKKGASPPPPPDPTVVANAQSAANIASATAQQHLNMVGTAGPNGTVNYVADPSQPGGYTQTTTLSPAQQAIYNSGNQAQQGSLNVANQQIGRVGEALARGLDPGQLQTNYGQGGPLQTGFNPGQQVQGHAGYQDINGSVNQAANNAYQQATSRLDPQWQLSQRQEETQLANQGLGANSTAYQNAMDIFNRAKTDAYNQANFGAINTGNAEQNTLMGQQLAQGSFANSAAGQQYAQNQGQAAFNNQAAAQQYAQNQNAALFANQAGGQQFQQNAYAQAQPINEFNSLMSSSQVATPQGIQYTPSSVNPTDVTGAYALNSQVAQANYNSQMQNQGSNLGGLFRLGASVAAAPFTSGTSMLGHFMGGR